MKFTKIIVEEGIRRIDVRKTPEEKRRLKEAMLNHKKTLREFYGSELTKHFGNRILNINTVLKQDLHEKRVENVKKVGGIVLNLRK